MGIYENIQVNDKQYLLKDLNKEDKIKIKDLFDRCYDYFYLVEGRKTNKESIKELLEDLPPDKNSKDKHVLGIFDNVNLIGVIDLVENYPSKHEWIIGLMLIDPNVRGEGLGQKVHEVLEEISKKGQANKLRIGVVEQNKAALKFWKNVGYTEIKRTEPLKYGNKENRVIVMNYLI